MTASLAELTARADEVLRLLRADGYPVDWLELIYGGEAVAIRLRAADGRVVGLLLPASMLMEAGAIAHELAPYRLAGSVERP